MSDLVLEVTQGSTYSRPLQVRLDDGTPATSANSGFSAGSVLSAAIWEGQNQAPLVAPTVTWWTNGGTQTGYDQGQVLITILAASTVPLNPAGEYLFEIDSTTSSVQTAIIEGRVKIVASAGSTSPAPPDLITYDYAQAALAALSLTAGQRAFLPYAVAAASKEIRRWCFDRDFTQQTYTGEIYPVALNGYIRLAQMPVNQILSVQTSLTTALEITNGAAQQASVQFNLAGDVELGQTVTGINLLWTLAGAVNTQNVPFVAGQTIADLATLLNAVGSGWSAAATGFGDWPVTELTGGLIAQGSPSREGQPARLQVFSQFINTACFHPDDGQRTGLIWVGQQQRSGISDRWGPSPSDWSSTPDDPGVVKVSYNAGFAVIPAIVQMACAEIVKIMLQRMKINPFLESYRAGEVAYTLAQQIILTLPPYVLQELSTYRIFNA